MGKKSTSEYPNDTSTLPKSINFGCDVNEYELNNGKCRNGGYPDPLKNCKCRCPDGYGGNKCDKYEYANCKVIELTAKVKKQYISTEFGKGKCFFAIKLHQNDDKDSKIEAKRITIKIEKLEGFDCKIHCENNYIEIKYREDKSATGARICCIDYNRLLTINSEDYTEVLIMKKGNIGEYDISYQKELAPSQAASNCIEVRKSIYNPMYLQHYRVIYINLEKKIELPPTYGPRFCLNCNRNRTMIINGVHFSRNHCVEDKNPDPKCSYKTCFYCKTVENYNTPNWYWENPEGEWIYVTSIGCYPTEGLDKYNPRNFN
uniref:EGF-like domain-containing protein n=1 Tax=Meloidogyne enterolobii TaxID=390850 RepID=A0A6V7VX37_MELEN|nr:unnamed protein product [Meloidogyne enterolobii]